MSKGQGGSRRYAFTIIGGIVALSLVGCGTLSLLPRQADGSAGHFANFAQLQSAYDKIMPGTPASQLSGEGFDSSQGGAEVLSYLGVIEHFMPTDSRKFDALAEPVKDCIAARNRCTALVFHPAGLNPTSTGNVMLDVLGFARNAVNHSASAAVTLFLQDGRVAYKTISGGTTRQASLN